MVSPGALDVGLWVKGQVKGLAWLVSQGLEMASTEQVTLSERAACLDSIRKIPTLPSAYLVGAIHPPGLGYLDVMTTVMRLMVSALTGTPSRAAVKRMT